MFTDPVSLTYATVAKSSPRVGTDGNKSRYLHVQTDGTEFALELSHEETKGGRERCVARLKRSALVSNPLVTGQSRPAELTVTVTMDRDSIHTPQEAVDLFSSLRGFLTDANVLRLAAGET